jgi:pyrrolidone-carboxylate peptidase
MPILIADDTRVSVSITVSNIHYIEFTFIRTGSTVNRLTVFCRLTGIANGVGVISTKIPIVIKAGTNIATLTINARTHSLTRLYETISLVLINNADYIVDTVAPVVVNVIKDVAVSVVATNSISGENSANNLIYTFTRTGYNEYALKVNYILSGSATNGFDYALVPDVVIFSAGSDTAALIIDPLPDNITELTETISLELVPSTEYIRSTINPVVVNIVNFAVIDFIRVSVGASIQNIAEDSVVNSVYTFTRTGSTATPLTVDYTLGGTATNGIDYTLVPTSVTFAAGSSTTTLIIDPIVDVINETTKTVSLNLINGGGYTSITPNPVVINILNNNIPAEINLTAANVSITESGTTNSIYTFTRNGDITNSLNVNYTLGGTATNGVDYVTIGTSVTFAAGSATTTLVIDPIVDVITEATETVSVTLVGGLEYVSVTPNPVSIDIINYVLPTEVSLSAINNNIVENGSISTIYTFTRSGSTTSPVTVNYTLGGTATNGVDYQLVGTSITFSAGSSTAQLLIEPIIDAITEATETVSITLTAGSGYTILTPNPVVVNLLDSDVPLPEIVITANTTGIKENNGIINTGFTFTRNGSTANPLTVNYTIAGTATGGVDYTIINSSVIIAAGSYTAMLVIDPNIDNVDEPTETIELTVLSSSEYTVVTPNPVTINLIDYLVGVSLFEANYPNVTEGGVFNATFTLQRTGDLSLNSLTVNYTIGGTAVNGVDYELIGTTATFSPADEYVTITIEPIVDAITEATETVTLTLAAGGGYEILTPDPVSANIIDAAVSPIQVSVVADVMSLNESSPGNVGFTFNRTGSTTSALIVNYTIGGTATNGTDYELIGNTITFDANSNLAYLIIDPIDDAISGDNETIIITLAAGGYIITTPDPVSLSIIDTTPTLPSISTTVVTPNVFESAVNTTGFIFTRTGSIANPLTVNYTLGGTTTTGVDYQLVGTSVTFAAGSNTTNLTIDQLSDFITEPTETVELTLLSTAQYISITTNPIILNILDDTPAVSVAATSANIEEDNLTNNGFQFTRTGSTTTPLTVNYTLGGTATNGTDYQLVGTSITFSAGSSTVGLIIDHIDDVLTEGTETVTLTLSANSGYAIATPAPVSINILDDDVETSSSLLLHFDGYNGSQFMVDSSPNGLNAFGTSTGLISIVQSKFGGSSLHTTGAVTSFIDIPDSPSLELANNDFTIDFWMYRMSTGYAFSKGNTAYTYSFYCNYITNRLVFHLENNSISDQPTTPPPLNTWAHLAYTRQNGVFREFLNGTQTRSYLLGTISDTPNSTYFGALTTVGGINAHFDELRIVIGRADYTANFTPPTVPYIN